MKQDASFPTQQDLLTEQRIKQLALGFLKRHYLQFYANELDLSKGEEAVLRDPGLVARLDQMLPGDIIVDGEIRFQRKDGRQFVATFEATSRETAGELRYRFQRNLLLWDGLATASMTALAVLALSYAINILPFDQWGWGFSLLIVSVEIGLLTLLFVLIMRHRSRYRYIYAIEQFKRYDADEHWIAFGEDVFDGTSDPYFVELRTQAVRQGVGLLEVTHSGQIRLFFLPRRQTPAISQSVMKAPSGQVVKWYLLLNQFNQRLWQWWPWKRNSRSYLRFKRSYIKQIGITLFAVLGIGLIMNKTIVHKPERRATRAELKQLEQLEEPPEPLDYLIDSPIVGAQPLVEEVVSVRTTTGGEIATPAVQKPASRPQAIFLNNWDKISFTDCARFANVVGPVWLVVDDWFDTYDEALQQLSFWESEGQMASLLWTGCLQGNFPGGFVVFLGEMYPDKKAAQHHATQFEARVLDHQASTTNDKLFELVAVYFDNNAD